MKFVIALLDAMGFDGLSAGRLSGSWRQSPGRQHTVPIQHSKSCNPCYGMPTAKNRRPIEIRQRKSWQDCPDFPPQEFVRVARLSAGLDTLSPRSWMAAVAFGPGGLQT